MGNTNLKASDLNAENFTGKTLFSLCPPSILKSCLVNTTGLFDCCLPNTLSCVVSAFKLHPISASVR